ncbi:LysR family transcriptional regulator [Polymorphum gilvum]|uniref:LysR family transcriptional regulator n=1 Tax=Polymorphum gilvum (strain LMG 25793 / CGMCC 1.9160 / SL003B-26A1) TaxID=991905 RepID=F2IXH8_POLGS|nr:LysR family transcriptional regulator [Polymorphum gilvum]ADZ71601.1 LysR family transcriptional regulator [Polymorphum gilvum SL003B-26A1]
MPAPRFSLRQLHYFVTVAELGSIRDASSLLNVSQTALSQALSELEREIGTTLLHRRRAIGANLTSAGTMLLGRARAVLDAAGDFEAAAQNWEHELAGRLGVSCYSTLSPFLAARLLGRFREEHPMVRIDFRDSSAERMAADLRQGRCELGLTYEIGLDDDICRERLYWVRPHLILPAVHPLASRTEIALEDVVDEPLILYDVPPAAANTLGMFARLGLTPRISYRTENFELVRSLVGGGFGYSLLLQQPSADVAHDGSSVVRRPISSDTGAFAIVIAWSDTVRLSKKAEVFKAFCKSVLAGGHRPEVKENSASGYETR